MEFRIKLQSALQVKSVCAIIGVFEQQQLSSTASYINQLSNNHLQKILQYGDFTGEFLQTLLLYEVPNTQTSRILLVGCGNKDKITEQQFRKIINKAISTLKTTGVTDASCYLTDLTIAKRDYYWKARQIVECTGDALYTYDQTKSKKTPIPSLQTLTLLAKDELELITGQQAIKEGTAIVHGMNLTRDLGNMPSNICTPTYLAGQAQQLAKQFRKIRTEILEQKHVEKLGMGAYLAVTKGSKEPPKFICMQYHGGHKNDQPIVFVGKGITFDTGGISIKLAPNLDEMKFDMCGAASILGTFNTLAELELPINVVALIPCCENMPGSGATKPGDIVTSMSGQTIEILNTDAEGRLILCDALTYSEQFNPAFVLDIATLTGSVILALGNQATGLFSNDEGLSQQIIQASEQSCDRVWQFPLWEEYQEPLASNFADVANIGPREGASIIAASFLARFTQKLRWAHLDIAGVAFRSGKEKGTTGKPVPLLIQFLLNYYQKQCQN